MNRRRRKQIITGLAIAAVLAVTLYASGVFSKSKKNVSFSQQNEERVYREEVHQPEETHVEIDAEMELL